MKRSIFLLAMFFSGCALTALTQGMAASQPPAAGEPMGKITAAAVWQPSQDVITKAHSFCDKSMGAASFPECFMNQLAAAGAPAEAVAFMRGLYQHSNGQVGIMSAFKSFGHVDAAQVLYPLRANDNYGLLLVNGDPNLIDVDDMKKLDQAAMQQDSMFRRSSASIHRQTSGLETAAVTGPGRTCSRCPTVAPSSSSAIRSSMAATPASESVGRALDGTSTPAENS